MGAGEVGEGNSVGTGISVGEVGCAVGRALPRVRNPAAPCGTVGELGAGRDLTAR